MNVGQVLETHLGWASVNLGKKISRMVSEYHETAQKIATLRDFLLELYSDGAMHDKIKNAKDKELLELAEKLSKGIYFATPVLQFVVFVMNLNSNSHSKMVIQLLLGL